MADPILCHKKNGVVTITINKPDKGNTIDADALQQLSDICQEVQADEQYRAIIVTGGGKYFCLGVEEGHRIPDLLPSVSSLFNDLTCPVIAAINGDAYAEGLEFALACDIRIAVPQARFCLPFIKTGTMPSSGGTQRLPRIVGLTKTMELILTGESIDAREALRIGLISSIVNPDELLPTVQKMADIMVTKSPLAISYVREAIVKGLDMTLEQGMRLEADLYFLLQTTEDRSEGIKAFREKRKAQFKGK